MEEGAFGGSAEPTQAAVHLHSGQGFVASVTRDGDAAPLLGSATLWRTLERHDAAAILDVEAGEIRLWNGDLTASSALSFQSGTALHLDAIDASHLLAVPLRAPGLGRCGMLSVALRASHVAGLDTGVSAAFPRLQDLADLGGLALALLRASGGEAAPRAAGPMAALLASVPLLAAGAEPILILGPPGSGKTWLAEHLHRQSGRARLRTARAGTLGVGSLEAELAGEGTLLIEDLPDLSRPCQARLLAWMTEGASGPRLLLTSGVSPAHLKATGELLPELATTLGTWALELPSYAARHAEIPALAAALLAEITGAAPPALGPDAPALLTGPDGPRNLHELRHTLQLGWQEATLRHRADGGLGLPAELRGADLSRALARLRHAETVLDQLRPAAALVAAARRAPLTLKHSEGFAGLVLAEALEQGLGVPEAAALFGLGHQVEDGNHWKSLRAARDKLEALCGVLDEPLPEVLRTTLAPKWRQGG